MPRLTLTTANETLSQLGFYGYRFERCGSNYRLLDDNEMIVCGYPTLTDTYQLGLRTLYSTHGGYLAGQTCEIACELPQLSIRERARIAAEKMNAQVEAERVERMSAQLQQDAQYRLYGYGRTAPDTTAPVEETTADDALETPDEVVGNYTEYSGDYENADVFYPVAPLGDNEFAYMTKSEYLSTSAYIENEEELLSYPSLEVWQNSEPVADHEWIVPACRVRLPQCPDMFSERAKEDVVYRLICDNRARCYREMSNTCAEWSLESEYNRCKARAFFWLRAKSVVSTRTLLRRRITYLMNLQTSAMPDWYQIDQLYNVITQELDEYEADQRTSKPGITDFRGCR